MVPCRANSSTGAGPWRGPQLPSLGSWGFAGDQTPIPHSRLCFPKRHCPDFGVWEGRRDSALVRRYPCLVHRLDWFSSPQRNWKVYLKNPVSFWDCWHSTKHHPPCHLPEAPAGPEKRRLPIHVSIAGNRGGCRCSDSCCCYCCCCRFHRDTRCWVWVYVLRWVVAPGVDLPC